MNTTNKHYYITTEPPLIVSDEDIKARDNVLLPNFSIQKMTDSDMIDYLDSQSLATKKIIAGLPNQPTIDHSDLSDEDCKVIGWVDVDKLAEELAYKRRNIHAYTEEYCAGVIDGYEEAFKTAQSLNDKKWSDEDVINAAKYGYEFRDTTSFPEHKFEDSCINNFKQYLQAKKLQIFEIEAILQDNKVKILKVK